MWTTAELIEQFAVNSGHDFLLSSSDLAQLCSLAKIPNKFNFGFSIFLDGLTKEFKHNHTKYGTSPQNAYQETETKLEKIKDAAENLLNMISSLDRNTSNILGAFHVANLKYPDEMEHNKANILEHFMAAEGDTKRLCHTKYLELLEYAFFIRNAAQHHDWRQHFGYAPNSKNISNKFNPNITFFDKFVFDCASSIYSLGGRIRANRDNTDASMNLFLDVLRHYLPEAIPPLEQDSKGKLPGQARLARLVSEAKKDCGGFF